MRIIIFGGTGFLGQNLVPELLKQGHSVRIFARQNLDKDLLKGAEYFYGNFNDEMAINKAIKGADTIIHLYSATDPKKSSQNPIYDVEENLIPTIKLLKLASQSCDIKKIIFASSGGTVYGTPQTEIISESHPTDPIVPYGIVKLAIEKFLLSMRNDRLQIIVLRLANPYGEYQDPTKGQGLIASILWKTLQGAPTEIWGDGEVIRDYLHVDDAVKAFVCALSYAGSESIFNVGSGTGLSINMLIKKIENILQLKVDSTYRNQRSCDIKKNILDISLIKKEFNWAPSVALDEGIQRTYRFLSKKY